MNAFKESKRRPGEMDGNFFVTLMNLVQIGQVNIYSGSQLLPQYWKAGYATVQTCSSQNHYYVSFWMISLTHQLSILTSLNFSFSRTIEHLRRWTTLSVGSGSVDGSDLCVTSFTAASLGAFLVIETMKNNKMWVGLVVQILLFWPYY